MKKCVLSILVVMTMALVLVGSITIMASAEAGSPVKVTNETELVAAINNSTGTADNPTLIEVQNNITLTHNIVVGTGKFITIRGVNNSITLKLSDEPELAKSPRQYSMFDIGTTEADIATELSFENIVFDPNNRARAMYIYGSGTKVTISDCTITHGGYGDTVAEDPVQGAGACLADGSSLIMNNSRIVDNWTGASGGAIRIYTNCRLEIYGGELANNYAGAYGGAININGTDTTIKLDGVIITNNTGRWAAISYNWSYDTGTLILKDCRIYDNINTDSKQQGVDISLSVGECELSGDVRIAESETGAGGIGAGSKQTLNVVGPLAETAVIAIRADNGIPTITGDGYQFDGWYTQRKGGEKVTASCAKTLYAHWTPVTYNISYDLNKGYIDAQNPATYNIETADFKLHNPTRADYKFKGWSGTDLDGDTNVNVTIAKGNTGDRSYTANWTPITCIITKGEGQTYTLKSNKNLTFTGDEAYSKFTGVKVNGSIIADSCYTAVSGSTVVTLKNSYLESLQPGTYTFCLVYEDGESNDIQFKVEKAQPTEENAIPKTGDNSNLFLWLALAAASGAALIGIRINERKRSFK